MLHINTNEDVIYDMYDKDEQGNKWLRQIEEYIQRHMNYFSMQEHKSLFDILEDLFWPMQTVD